MSKKNKNNAVKNSKSNKKNKTQQHKIACLPIDYFVVCVTIFRLTLNSEWTTKQITTLLVKACTGFELTQFEINSIIKGLKALRVIVRHPENDWQYRIADAYIMSKDGEKRFLMDFERNTILRWRSVMLSRMARNGRSPKFKELDLELSCVLCAIHASSKSAVGTEYDYSRIPINAKAVRDETDQDYSEIEIQLFLKELIRLKVIAEHPSENGRYKISEQYLLFAEGVASLLVAPIQEPRARTLFIVRERIRRSGLKLDSRLPIITSFLSYCVIKAFHLKSMSCGACENITSEEVFLYTDVRVEQADIDNGFLALLCDAGILIKDASGKMRIADSFILKSEGIETLLIVPPDDPAKW